MFFNMKDAIPTSGSAAVGASEGHPDEVWMRFNKGDEEVLVLPNNLESLGDDPLVMALSAAAQILGLKTILSPKTYTPVKYDKKQKMYLFGVGWGLNNKTKFGDLNEYQALSGAMGHGFYWVAHTAFQSKVGSSSWAKGQGWNPVRGTTGKAWSTDISSEARRAFAVLRAAAAKVDVLNNWHTYVRPKESFIGKEIRKELRFTKEGILSSREVAYLKDTYPKAIACREQVLDMLESKDMGLDDIKDLPRRFAEAGSASRVPEVLADKIVSHRINLIYPKGKRERKNAKKRPIQELISEMEPEAYIHAFDPCLIAGMKPFHISVSDREDYDSLAERLQYDYNSRIASLRKRGREGLADLAEEWALSYLTPSFLAGE
jgi:hypothetical protein